MILPKDLQERLQFLARVVVREVQQLLETDQRLFANGFGLEEVQHLNSAPDLAERVDAFVSRFGRLQDTVGDKVLPAWRSAVGETPATVADNLDRAERLGLIPSADLWLGLRRLRNQMVHEYIEDPSVLSNALNTAHTHLTVLTDAADALLADLAQRGVI